MRLQDFVDNLQQTLEESDYFEEEIHRVNDFEGLLTNNKGLIVSMKDGSEYQITIVPSNAKGNQEDDED